MTPDVSPPGWLRGRYGDLFEEIDARAEERIELPVLSVTKTRGPMLASERFGKVMHGRDLSRYRLAPRNHVVADPMLLWDGSIGLQRVVEVGLVSPDYRVYAPSARADPSYVGYLVRSPAMLPFYQGGARGTNVRRNRIARSDFLAIPVAVPPISEQRKIAVILSSVDDAIETTRAVIDQLQVVKKAMMAELLTRGIPGRHAKFRMTEIGEVPEAWEVLALSECIREPIRNGYSPVCPTSSTGRWMLHLGAVTHEGFNRSAVKHAPTDDSRLESAVVAAGDILVSRSNTRDRVGLAGLYAGSPSPCFYPDLLMRVRANARLMPEFLEAVLLSARPREYLSSSARGTSESMVKINRDILLQLPVQVPPIGEQREIVAVLSVVSDRLDAEREASQAQHQLKAALMSVLLTGEVRVQPDEDSA